MFIGIDGCRGGWVAATLDGQPGAPVRYAWLSALDEVLEYARAGRATIVVDIPIGLPAAGARRCDIEARRLLGRARQASVFSAPSRAALDGAGDYAAACRLNERAVGTRLSRQAFGILPKIAEMDALITPALQAAVREGHPEVVFRVLARGGLAASKRTAEGRAERLALLATAGVDVAVEEIRARLGRSRVAPDDVLDAAACAVAARRVAAGEAVVFPLATSERDERGLLMEIVA
ncbi:MAG: DUF429 domain-containing protein [Vicinamibacterales bacterium]